VDLSRKGEFDGACVGGYVVSWEVAEGKNEGMGFEPATTWRISLAIPIFLVLIWG